MGEEGATGAEAGLRPQPMLSVFLPWRVGGSRVRGGAPVAGSGQGCACVAACLREPVGEKQGVWGD